MEFPTNSLLKNLSSSSSEHYYSIETSFRLHNHWQVKNLLQYATLSHDRVDYGHRFNTRPSLSRFSQIDSQPILIDSNRWITPQVKSGRVLLKRLRVVCFRYFIVARWCWGLSASFFQFELIFEEKTKCKDLSLLKLILHY